MAETKGMSLADIEEYAEQYSKRVLSAAGAKIRDEMFKVAKTAIVQFYKSYPKNGEPLYYHRYYKNFMAYPGDIKKNEKAFRKIYDNKHGNIVYAGIELTPSLMDPVYGSRKRPTPTQEVVDTVFAGFHGPAGMFYEPKTFSTIPPRMVPSPRQQLLDKRQEIIDHQGKYLSYGKRVAKRENPLFVK